MKRTKTANALIHEMGQMLHNKPSSSKRLTVESLVFDNDEPGFDYDSDAEFDEMPSAPKNNNITGIINQIRQIALQGIAQLADSPESAEYDTLKKVWQIIDKNVETKNASAKQSQSSKQYTESRLRHRNRLNEGGHLFSQDDDGTVYTNSKETWRGVKGSKFIWHGEWSDPEVLYQGELYNAEELDAILWSNYKEYCEEEGITPSENDFDKWAEGYEAEMVLYDAYPSN